MQSVFSMQVEKDVFQVNLQSSTELLSTVVLKSTYPLKTLNNLSKIRNIKLYIILLAGKKVQIFLDNNDAFHLFFYY